MITLVIPRQDVIDRVMAQSRLAEWCGSWALQFDPKTGQTEWFWDGPFPPSGTNTIREPRDDWQFFKLPRIDANKLTVDARNDRIEDWVWKASAEGTLDGWLDSGEPRGFDVKLKMI